MTSVPSLHHFLFLVHLFECLFMTGRQVDLRGVNTVSKSQAFQATGNCIQTVCVLIGGVMV